MSTSDVASLAEAFLFSEGGSLTRRKLAQLLNVKDSELGEPLKELHERLSGRGLTLVETEIEVSLAIASEASKAVQAAHEREQGHEIGEAGLEVLAIVLYRGPSTRAEVDYIRGVNTASTLRNLLARGLLERTGNPDDAREYLYRPTVELLAHLGITNTHNLPDYATITRELASFEAGALQSENHAGTGSADDTRES